MIKKYKFKLDGLLKLREFTEDKAKIELGKVNLKIQKIQDDIDNHHKDIATAYDSQTEILKTPTDGRFLQFYPLYYQAKEAAIKDLEMKKGLLMEEAKMRMQDLLKARAEMKLMEKLKEKDFTDWKKARNKEMDQKIEENTQMWLGNSGVRVENED
ncbi:MAG: flagellar export protein FliJ [Bacteriovoracaceae bacterium]